MELKERIRDLKREMHSAAQRLEKRGRRIFAAALCACLIAGVFPPPLFFQALADDNGSADYEYELMAEDVCEAVQRALSEGTTLDEDLAFAGEMADEYEELFEADGTLYELKSAVPERDRSRDKVLDLKIFARIDGDIPLDAEEAGYTFSGDEQVIFLLTNRSDEEVSAVISVDGRRSEGITVLSASMIAVDGNDGTKETAGETSVGEGGETVSAGSEGGSGGGSGSGESAGESRGDYETSGEESGRDEDDGKNLSDGAERESNETDSADDAAEDEKEGPDADRGAGEDRNGSEEAGSDKDTDRDPEKDGGRNSGNGSDEDGGSSDDRSDNSGGGSSESGKTNDGGSADGSRNAGGTGGGGPERSGSGSGGDGGGRTASVSSNRRELLGAGSGGHPDEDKDIVIIPEAVYEDVGDDDGSDPDVSVVADTHGEPMEGTCELIASVSDASPSDAGWILSGDVYGPVLLAGKGAAAFATTAEELGSAASRAGQVRRDITYSAKDDGVKVTVIAPEKALPEDAELVVTRFDENSSEFAEAAEAISYEGMPGEVSLIDADETGIAYPEDTGIVVMDISFMLDGERIEPAGSVFVNIDVSDIVPHDIDEMTTWHFEGPDGFIGPVVVDVGDGADGLSEFEIESFSTFTVTWHSKRGSAKISVECYFEDVEADADGEDGEISWKQNEGLGPENLDIAYDNEFIFNDRNGFLDVEGYSIDHADMVLGDKIEVKNVYSITAIMHFSGENSAYTYEYKTSADGEPVDIGADAFGGTVVKLYYLYTGAGERLRISGDAISSTGRLTAEYDGKEELKNFDQEYYYKWYRMGDDDDDWIELVGWTSDTYPLYASSSVRYTYRVELHHIGTGALIDSSSAYLVPYYRDVVNGSFEDVDNGDIVTMQYTDGLYADMVWRTTGFGSLKGENYKGADIEIVKPKENGSSGTSYGVEYGDVADGGQFAELNCEYNGTLYQDIFTLPEEEMSWTLRHRARYDSNSMKTGKDDAVDTMCVIAMPTDVADKEFTADNATNQQIMIASLVEESGLDTPEKGSQTERKIFEHTFDDGETATVYMWLISSGADTWGTYSGWYDVPEGQYLTRFMFGAVSTASGDQTMGNLIDAVSMDQQDDLDADGYLVIEKEISGLPYLAEISAGAFKFEIYETTENSDYESQEPMRTVRLPTADTRYNDPAEGSESLRSTMVRVSELGASNLTIVESSPTYLNGYKHDSTSYDVVYSGEIENGGSAGEGDVAIGVIVGNESNTRVTFTNVYDSHLTLQKISTTDYSVIDGAEFQISNEENGAALKFTVDEETVGEESRTVYTVAEDGDSKTVESIGLGSAVIKGLEITDTVGEDGDKTGYHYYYLTEAKAPEGYKQLDGSICFYLDGSGQVVIGERESGATKLPTDDSMTLSILNEPVITIYKYTGDGDEEEAQAPLAEAQFVLANGSGEYAVFADDGGSDDEADGSGHTVYTFESWSGSENDRTVMSSGADGYIQLEGLSAGEYTLTETKAPDGYTVGKGSYTFTVNSDGSVSMSEESVTVIRIRNDPGAEFPGAGGTGTVPFRAAGLLITGAGVAACGRRKKRSGGRDGAGGC